MSICQDAALNAMNENIETLDVRPSFLSVCKTHARQRRSVERISSKLLAQCGEGSRQR